MRTTKLALVLAGLIFGSSAYALDTQTNEAPSDAEIFLFNEGDQPADAEEAEVYPTDSPDSARTRISCRSNDYRMKRCYVDGRIRSVRLVQRTSYAPCIAGRTFGATPRYVWVSRGCSGNFLVQYRRTGGY